jgi:hypothetical protein
MGGWGVDALVGSQTREHHDLDVLALGDDLPALADVFDDEGFVIQHVWEAENRWLDVDGTRWPTAFVAANRQGVELDIHLMELHGNAVLPLCNVPWPLDAESLKGRGVIREGGSTACRHGATPGQHPGDVCSLTFDPATVASQDAADRLGGVHGVGAHRVHGHRGAPAGHFCHTAVRSHGRQHRRPEGAEVYGEIARPYEAEIKRIENEEAPPPNSTEEV